MARPREFNEDEALERAMEIFWRKGYENTSLDDLLDAMGIQRGSFYNTFGSKRETYLRTLKWYRKHVIDEGGGPFAPLAQDLHGAAALQTLMQTFIQNVSSAQEPCGCFFAHASTEDRRRDPDVKAILRSGIKDAQTLIAEKVREAQGAGELDPELDAKQLALSLMAFAYGTQVLAACGLDKKELAGGGRQLFELLAD